ncbi:PEP-CTERM/exosortase system-associated acyltransferase [Roseateles violae]|uniref:PEP-CTERM/exosortase system-associated acyltransferase n=1 Tax=Roseateles violae TaxID=3058042 RepID=A0ABT8DST2_9BURK|nr:PEP-CTERM/exosortase system-associated acyltransferase [Pelomonas sp. PFR6]MDN3919216.1 PEP-CTERM/exosortase system-associated acyltransferase [Pelomonas sp. PFR6]
MNPSSSRRNLGGTFNELFKLEPALDTASKQEVYRIRHEVYCRDLGWEPVREDGMETDAYDEHSIHCLLRRRDSGLAVGCTRLILTQPEAPATLLPMEISCADVIDRQLVDPAALPRDTIGEVSRLAVVNSFRQRKGESGTPMALAEDDFGSNAGMPRFPFIPVSLYLGAAAIARHMGVEHVFVLTEPRLAAHFNRIGFDIRSIGGTIEHRGTRVPSVLSSSKVVAELRPLIKPLYEVIEASVKEGFRKHPDAAKRGH